MNIILVNSTPDVNETKERKMDRSLVEKLCATIAYGKTVDLLALIYGKETHVNVNAKISCDEYTPLHLAASVGRVDMALTLILRGADVNAKDVFGDTPLHRAAKKGDELITKVLLDNDANVFAKNNDGKIPSEMNHECVTAIKLLKKAEKDAGEKNKSIITIGHHFLTQKAVDPKMFINIKD